MFDRPSAHDDGIPLLSVVVPAHRGATMLEHALAALAASDLPRNRWELLVVDDGSDAGGDGAGANAGAARYADVVIRLPGPARGPAYARNRGFELTRGAFVAFVNSDVAVLPHTLRSLVEQLTASPELAAISATYDSVPAAPGLVTRYRNLVRHWEQRDIRAEHAELWAGCCVVRRGPFAAVGMFNEWHFVRPSVEAAELTTRLRLAGGEVRVAHELSVSHMRTFTLRAMLRDDVRVRRVERARLLTGRAAEGVAHRSSRVAWACEALTGAALIVAVAAMVRGSASWLV